MKVVGFVISFYKSNKIPFVLALVAFVFFFISKIIQIQSDEFIPTISTLLRHISFFSFLLSIFLFSVKKKKYIISNISLLFLLLMSLEIVLYFLLGMPLKENKKFGVPSLPADHIAMNIGSMPYADSVYHDCKMNGNDTVFDVQYTINEFHNRHTPNHDSTKNKYALFFGCSIGYGFGLEDNETLPYYFQESSGKYNSYNFAYNAHSTNHMLARLEYEDLSLQVEEKDGAAFYVFFWDHIHRAISTMERHTQWTGNEPYYYLDGDELVRNKLFKNGRYFTSKFYELIYQTSIIKYFEINIPSKLRDDHFDLVSEMVKKSKDIYTEQFGNDNFHVLIYPSYKAYEEEEFNNFLSYLERKNINVVDLSNYIEYSGEYTHNGDPHPNANTNELLSKELLNRIKSNK